MEIDPGELGQMGSDDKTESGVTADAVAGLQAGSGNVQINYFYGGATGASAGATPASEPGSPRYSASATRPTSKSRPAARKQSEAIILCPTCLSPLNWEEATLWRWDEGQDEYVQFEVPKGTRPEDRDRMARGAVVGCPDPGQVYGEMHFLPYEYGSHGKPIVLAFFGDAGSGKSSLLATLIHQIERGELDSLNVSVHAMDLALHRRSLDLYREMHRWRRVLPATIRAGGLFADAFIVRQHPGVARSVVFLDVESYTRGLVSTVAHLAAADGFIFIVDSTALRHEFSDQSASGAALNLLKASGALRQANVAAVLTKGDMLPIDHPLAHWLSMPAAGLDVQQIAQQRAEILGYLESIGAPGWDKLNGECGKLTLHVVSALGRWGATAGPQRVLEPFTAMLAMTGVLRGKDSPRIGG